MFRSSLMLVVTLLCVGGNPVRGEQRLGGEGKVEPITFAAPPMYAPAPDHAARGDAAVTPSADPVLVPLPPGVWAAVSGLAWLAMAAAWRQHRLREE